ncbi:MAG: DUF2809 domain-containing protein [Bacteroidia bacterium]
MHDRIIRPYVGDLLVVIFIYCFLKSFLNVAVMPLAISVLLFSFFVEITQYFGLIYYLNLENNKLALAILGKSFKWLDIIAYTVGILVVLGSENFLAKKRIV